MSDLISIMKKPISAESSSSLSHIISELLKNKISRLIVTKNDLAVGIITEKDIGLFLLTDDTEKNLDDIPASHIMHKIISVDDFVSIENCAKIMLEKQIGSLCIFSNTGDLTGIVTKTDIIQHFAQNSTGNHLVGEVMTISYISMYSDDPISSVVYEMIRNNVSRIFLKNNDGEPEGIITFRDLFHVALEQGNSESVLDNSDKAISIVFTRKGFLSDSGFGLTIKAKDVMTSNLESVDLEEKLSVACDILIQNKINGTGVRINGKLGGVISKTDILKAIYIDSISR